MGMLATFVLVSWLAAALGTASVLLNSTARFSALGRSKGRWLAIQVAGFIPYLGVFTALAYAIMVRLRMEARPRAARRPVSPGSARQAPGSRVRCPRCREGRVVCDRCGANWQLRQKIHCNCKGGFNPCRNCDGSGWVNA
jgi:hypothetical protein